MVFWGHLSVLGHTTPLTPTHSHRFLILGRKRGLPWKGRGVEGAVRFLSVEMPPMLVQRKTEWPGALPVRTG